MLVASEIVAVRTTSTRVSSFRFRIVYVLFTRRIKSSLLSIILACYSTFIQLDLLDRGCLVQTQVGHRFCNRHGDEAGDVANCFCLCWFYFQVSSLKIK